MIDFRYHLVSIIAVFLALAVGIVVGTAALNGPIVDSLKASNNRIIKDKRELEASVRDLRTQVSRRDDFARAVAVDVVGGELTGERVLFVAGPGSSGETIQALEELVTAAGGTPGGVLRLRDDLLDPGKSQLVEDVVAEVRPAGLELPEGTPVDRAAVELAAALMHKGGIAGLDDEAAAKVLGGFTSAELVQLDGPTGSKAPTDPTAPATLAVVVTGGSAGEALDEPAEQRQRSLLTLSRALDTRSKGVVVAGPTTAADTGGLLQALRGDGDLSERVSSVDAADTPYGQVIVVLALDEQAAGRSGRYGQGAGAQAAAPSPGP